MLNERTQSLAKAFKGKIYVFGGCAMGKEPFGECFNPELQEWTPIDCPRLGQDLRPGRGDMIAIPYDDNHLLVGPTPAADDNYYFLYNVEYNSWSVCPDSPIDIESCDLRSVILFITNLKGVIIRTGIYVPGILNLEPITEVL